MLVEPVGHVDVLLVRDDKNPVGVLLEGVGGELFLHIHRQEQHEGHRDGQAQKIDDGVKFVPFQKIEK